MTDDKKKASAWGEFADAWRESWRSWLEFEIYGVLIVTPLTLLAIPLVGKDDAVTVACGFLSGLVGVKELIGAARLRSRSSVWPLRSVYRGLVGLAITAALVMTAWISDAPTRGVVQVFVVLSMFLLIPEYRRDWPRGLLAIWFDKTRTRKRLEAQEAASKTSLSAPELSPGARAPSAASSEIWRRPK